MSSKLKLTNTNGNIATIENSDTIVKDVNIDVASITTAVDTVGDLVALDGSVSTVIVKDSDRGGIFNWEDTGTSNDGTIFDGSTGVWVRQYSGAVNVKWFGTDRASIQKAYYYMNSIGGGSIEWQKGSYTIAGTIFFGSNVKTNFMQSTITGDGSNLFETGYSNGTTMISNAGTSYTADKTTFENGTIYNTDGIGFKLLNFRFGSSINDIVFFNISQMIVGDTCFYSGYSNLIYFGDTDWVSGTANTTSGSTAIVVTDAIAATLSNGMEISSHFVEVGTIINTVGVAGSAGGTNAYLWLSNTTTKTGTAGGVNTGFTASLNPKGRIEFNTACSDMTFSKCSTGSSFVGFYLSQVNSTTFISCDVEACAYGFRMVGGSSNNTWTSTHTESIRGFVWDFHLNTGGGYSIIGGGNYFHVAGIATAGANGFLEGTITLPETMGAYTPYGYTPSAGTPWLDLSSPNATCVVIGGAGDTDNRDLNADSSSTFINSKGIRGSNIASTDPKSLDWYEEGVFVPVVEGFTTAGVGTYSEQYGYFTRIGDIVTVIVRISWTGHTGTGRLLFANPPFTPLFGARQTMPVSNLVATTNTTSFNQRLSIPASSNTKFDVVESGAIVLVETTGTLDFSGIYKT